MVCHTRTVLGFNDFTWNVTFLMFHFTWNVTVIQRVDFAWYGFHFVNSLNCLPEKIPGHEQEAIYNKKP